MDTSANALQPTSILKWLMILLPELAAHGSLETQKGNSNVPSASSALPVTAAKHLPVLFQKTSGGQRQWAAGNKQHLCHHSCFWSEYLLTAFQLYQEKVTKINIDSAIKMHAQKPGGHLYCHVFMYCHVVHVLPLRKYEVAHKTEYTTFTCFNEIL